MFKWTRKEVYEASSKKKSDEEQVCGKQDFGAALSLFYTTVYHRHLRSISGARMRSIEGSS